MRANDPVMQHVLESIFPKSYAVRIRQSFWEVNNFTVHSRWCSGQGGKKFPFNISPTTLSADYELWVCGSEFHYYLIPIRLLEQIYSDAETYVDNTFRQLRTVTVDLTKHDLLFARGAKRHDIGVFYRPIRT